MVIMLTQCCCGCSLKTGTIVIGILNLIGALSETVFGIVVATGYNPYHITDQGQIDAMNVNRGAYITIAVVAAIYTIFCVLLIIGAMKDKPVFLLPWMGYATVATLIYVIICIVISVGSVTMGDTVKAITTPISGLISLILQIYFILVVYSLYRELKEEELRRPADIVKANPEEAAALNAPPLYQETV